MRAIFTKDLRTRGTTQASTSPFATNPTSIPFNNNNNNINTNSAALDLHQQESVDVRPSSSATATMSHSNTRRRSRGSRLLVLIVIGLILLFCLLPIFLNTVYYPLESSSFLSHGQLKTVFHPYHTNNNPSRTAFERSSRLTTDRTKRKTGSNTENRLAELDCSKYGGPDKEVAQEMVYWKDIPSDATFKSPYLVQQQEQQKSTAPTKYITFESDLGGFNNMRMGLETVIALAVATGRTLVLPPDHYMYLLSEHKPDNPHLSFSDFFPVHEMAATNEAFRVIRTDEFLQREGVTGRLRDRTTGQVSYPPNRRVHWDGEPIHDLLHWLRNVTNIPPWNYDKCLITIPERPNDTDAKNRLEHSLQEALQLILRDMGEEDKYPSYPDERYFTDHPEPVDGTLPQRLKEHLAGRKKLCLYDTNVQNEPVLHFHNSDDFEVRLLVHFYAYMFSEDWKMDLWIRRFVRDHVRYRDVIQCAAARIVHALRQRVRQHNNNNKNNKDGSEDEFDTFHIRRGDFQFVDAYLSADKIYEIVKEYIPDGSTLYIATDEKNQTYFDPLREHYHLYFLKDFVDQLEGIDAHHYGMIDQLVASRGRTFFGCWWSTFTTYINRLRGYHSVKGKTPVFPNGTLPNSYYYVIEDVRFLMHRYSVLSPPFFVREFPTAWRDIEHDLLQPYKHA